MNQGIVLYLKSGYIIFDEDDFDLVASYKWRVSTQGYVTYLKYEKGQKPKGLYLHRMILGVTDKNELVDHKNHNTRDNRRCNIRRATAADNSRNTTSYGKCGYLGVHYHPGWKGNRLIYARITVNRKAIFLGSFPTVEDAALAYNNAAKIHFGEFANLNKIE